MRADRRRRRAAVAGALLAVAGLVLACGESATARPRPIVPGGDAARGARLLSTFGCAACHRIPGVQGANRSIGPPLAGLAERAFIAGRVPNRPETLVRWIMRPQEIEAGTAMPDLGVSEADARDMAAYLYTLEQRR